MNTPSELNSVHAPLLGTVCCLLSALSYAAANTCLRQLAALDIEPAWVICVKETVAVTVLAPWVIYRVGTRQLGNFPLHAIWVLILAGLAVELLGNLGIQWAFGVIGLTISMPLVFGMMLSGSAVGGWLLFNESLSRRSLLAIGIVILAVALLSGGATNQNASTSSETIPTDNAAVALGIAAACLGGLMFAMLAAAIRYVGGLGVPVTMTVVVVTGTGVLSLGLVSLLRLGGEALLRTDPHALAWMIAAGGFNLVGFALIIRGLQLTTLVHANVLNASQVALGGVAGILLFHEPYNACSLSGVALTIAGIALYGQPSRGRGAARGKHLA